MSSMSNHTLGRTGVSSHTETIRIRTLRCRSQCTVCLLNVHLNRRSRVQMYCELKTVL